MIKIPFAQAQQTFNKLVSDQTKCIVLFTGEPNQQGVNWCPDCQNIRHLYSTFEQQCKSHNLLLYVFIAGDRPTWKNPQNYFRVNKLIRINNVPTMGLFDGKKLLINYQEIIKLLKNNKENCCLSDLYIKKMYFL